MIELSRLRESEGYEACGDETTWPSTWARRPSSTWRSKNCCIAEKGTARMGRPFFASSSSGAPKKRALHSNFPQTHGVWEKVDMKKRYDTITNIK